VWLAANSMFKSDSDLAKYEKARKLKVRLVHISKASLSSNVKSTCAQCCLRAKAAAIDVQ